MQSRVAIISQATYESKSLERSIRRSIDLIGFDLASVQGKNVLLKPNLLGAYPPEMGVTTDPAFVAAAAKIFIAAGAKVSVGDSPNGIFEPDKCWEVSGLRDACRSSGACEAHFEKSGNVDVEGLLLAKAAMEADILVNLPKFKTHSLTVLTVAAKNLFGCVNGMLKTAHHRQNCDRGAFAEVLVKIAKAANPALTIVDGIIAMEGDGPMSGNLKNLGAVIAGTDVHAVDAACCKLIGLAPLEMDTLAVAKLMGLWSDEPELTGDPVDKIRLPRFILPMTHRTGFAKWRIFQFLQGLIWPNLSSQPVIDKGLCEMCRLCVKACPVDAIKSDEVCKTPKIDEDTCIQCFCCHEVCPHGAIGLKQSLLTRLGRWRINRMRYSGGKKI